MGVVLKLHLGVIEIPYDEGDQNTGEVAEFLEARYQIMQHFFSYNESNIISLLENSIAGNLENIIAGAPPSSDPFAEAMSEIHNLFVIFLQSKDLDGRVVGVPTMRALKGIRRRLKNKRGQPRESFIDTGLYMASMRAWVSEVMNAEH